MYFYLFIYLYLLRQGLPVLPKLQCDLAPGTLTWSTSTIPTLASSVARTLDTCHYAWLIFLVFIFCRDGVPLRCPGWSQTPALKQSSHFGLPDFCDYKPWATVCSHNWYRILGTVKTHIISETFYVLVLRRNTMLYEPYSEQVWNEVWN